jgi:hypothetical protein
MKNKYLFHDDSQFDSTLTIPTFGQELTKHQFVPTTCAHSHLTTLLGPRFGLPQI